MSRTAQIGIGDISDIAKSVENFYQLAHIFRGLDPKQNDELLEFHKKHFPKGLRRKHVQGYWLISYVPTTQTQSLRTVGGFTI